MAMTRQSDGVTVDPHAGQPVLTAGPAVREAEGVLVLVHGRGATARSILPLYDELGVSTLAAIAPQAAGNTWYPQSFLAPLETNQPWLDSALRQIETIIADLIAGGVRSERIALLGFSQGACLTLEYVARHPRRYGAVMGLTGGLIGPPGTVHSYAGSLEGTRVFLGNGDPDPHVPFERVAETAAVLERMGATVELRRYPGRPHTISEDEVEACRALLREMAGRSEARPDGPTMRITRVFADAQGESHFADMEIELKDAGEIGQLSQAIPAKAVVFRRNEPGYDYDWHVASRRQFIVLLDGAIEIEASDGNRRTFRGGEVLLMEDTIGKGHRTRNVEKRERRSVFVVLE